MLTLCIHGCSERYMDLFDQETHVTIVHPLLLREVHDLFDQETHVTIVHPLLLEEVHDLRI